METGYVEDFKPISPEPKEVKYLFFKPDTFQLTKEERRLAQILEEE